MNNILDDLHKIRSIDKSDLMQILKDFYQQCQEGIKIGNQANLPDITTIQSIVYTGMGGSAIGGDLLRTYLADELKIPMLVNRNYTIPNFVHEKSLLIVSSYSGNTEETLAAYESGRKNNAQIISITCGGELLKRSEKDGYIYILIPGGLPPRMAVGYTFFALLTILQRLNIIRDKTSSLIETLNIIRQLNDSYNNHIPEEKNTAKILANRLYKKYPVIYSGTDLLESVVLRWKAQLAENAKCLSLTHVFPELNHNEIVGWEIQKEWLNQTSIIYLRDKNDHPRVKIRMDITKDILQEFAGDFTEIWTTGESSLARLWSMVYLGDYISYYLAILNGVDPTEIDKIDRLKNIMMGKV